MCGITGIFHRNQNRNVIIETLNKMTDIISHRGPDDRGIYMKNNIGLGHRRLSIIDLSTGDQPMRSEDGDLIIVFNGEIYNYVELREELRRRGYVFKSSSDTEVILHAYREWGTDCQLKFNGMWAFAIWDEKRKELFLSRDRIGEKPLFYSMDENTFLFGSEMKSIFEFGIPKTVDLRLAEVYLFLGFIPEPHTFYKNVRKLKAGHFLLVSSAGLKEYKYWDLPIIHEQSMNSDKREIYEKFEFLLEDSVRLRMRSDVPFGAFLSGGLDSSSLVALMNNYSEYQINTFTIGFPEKEFDESALAQLVANRFNTNHHRGSVDKRSFGEIYSKLAFHFDEPFGDASAIPTYYVSNYARSKVKMVLTGDGGDEVLSGYNSYLGIKLSMMFNSLPSSIQKGMNSFSSGINEFLPDPVSKKWNRIDKFLELSSLPFNERIIKKRAYVDYVLIKSLTSHLKDIVTIEDFFADMMKEIYCKDEFYKNMYLNFKYDLPNKYLVKVDRASMANSLETRAPFLDFRLIEYMVGVDKNVKLENWELKSVLKNTIGRKLPKEIVKGSKKGFDIPLGHWFKDGGIDVTLNQSLMEVKDYFDVATVERIVRSNSTGESDHGNFIWIMMMLDKFMR